jgi:sulfur carrier protein ThiS
MCDAVDNAVMKGDSVICEFMVEAATNAASVMDMIASDDAAFCRNVYDLDEGSLRPDVVVLHNDVLIDRNGGLSVELQDGDRLRVIQSLAGG